MKPVVAVVGPSDAGPGERTQMLDRAQRALELFEVESVVRIDVPAKGTSADDGTVTMRHPVNTIVPALQSGSLFGGKIGLLVVDAQGLLRAEAEVIAELVVAVDPAAVVAVFVSAGQIPAPLGKTLASVGEVIKLKKLRERDAGEWLAAAARERRLQLDGDASAALIQRFGSDVAALAQALDQLSASGEPVTGDLVRDRFKNRPDEPMWYYADAVADGKVGEALRRLEDFLLHGHPLQLTAFLEGELRRRALASAAPDLDTFASWIGSDPKAYPVQKAWRRRGHAKADDLHRALGALSRADTTLKTIPEPTHRVTMERLTVALCRWFGGGRV